MLYQTFDWFIIRNVNSSIGLTCLFDTFFGTRQYPKVQKFTKQPFPDKLHIHYIQKSVLLLLELIGQ